MDDRFNVVIVSKMIRLVDITRATRQCEIGLFIKSVLRDREHMFNFERKVEYDLRAKHLDLYSRNSARSFIRILAFYETRSNLTRQLAPAVGFPSSIVGHYSTGCFPQLRMMK